MRYRPMQWAHGPRWRPRRAEGERWEGFDAVSTVAGDVLMLPLHGHSRGHCGVAVRAPSGWLLHAGDAYFNRGEVHATPPTCPPFMSLFQKLTQTDGAQRMANQGRLHALAAARGTEIRIFSAHDPDEL
jgi:glyoxylase-like metal-dependent hydrolase (beta-lactamase superfamily II)